MTMAARSGMGGGRGTLQCPAVPRTLFATCLAVAALVTACGGDDDGSPASGEGTEQSTTQAAAVEFPRADDKTLRALRSSAPEGAVLSPSVSLISTGENRIGFALFDTSRKQVAPQAVALYVARPDGRRLRGPFRARSESLRVKPQFMSRQTAADLDDVDSFWVADVPFPKRGRYVLSALASLDGELISTTQIEMRAGARGGPPDVGEKAIRVHTDTPADVGGDIARIDTRIPPLAELHQVDFADVAGREPTVLTFATPQFCQTRVCGPVVDVVAQVRSLTDGVTFIHQEIYRDNEIAKGYRPQIAQWRLPSEPWTFVIDGKGRIVERFEGALSVRELTEAVRQVGRVG